MADATQDLTHTHTQKIVQFQEVTGTEDVAEARSQLENHAWDLEAAVQDHLALRESPPITPKTTTTTQNTRSGPNSNTWQNLMSTNERGGAAPGVGEGGGGGDNEEEGVRRRRRASNSDSPNPTNNTTTTTNRNNSSTSGSNSSSGGGSNSSGGGSGGGLLSSLLARNSVLSWGYYLITLPFRITFSSLSSIFLLVCRIVFPYPRRLTDPLGDVLAFISEFEGEYGTQHPAFFQGSYSQALTHAKAELKFLLVYLHCHDHQHSPLFCRSTLSDFSLMEYINSNMVFWGCSVTSPEGYRVSQALRENSYPFLALVVLRDNRMTVVGRLEGPTPPAALVQRLQAIVRENEAHLVVARAERYETVLTSSILERRRQEREMTAALRLQQDEDYQMSLRADQEKERRKQQEREEAERKVEEERKIEEERQREEDNIKRLKVEWQERIPQEPEEGAEGVIHISVKLPQGTRLERRFLDTDSLDALYYYIFCHPDAPDRFQVTTNFPRRVVPCEPTTTTTTTTPTTPTPTFQEYRLPPRSMLFVSDLDA